MIAKRHGFKTVGQADAIKELAREPFGLTQDQLYGPSASRNAVVEHLNTPEYVARFKAVAHHLSMNFDGKGTVDFKLIGIVGKMETMAPAKLNIKLLRLASKFFLRAAPSRRPPAP